MPTHNNPVDMYGPYPSIDERGNGGLAPRLIAVVRVVQVTPQVLMPQLAHTKATHQGPLLFVYSG